jgi:hypothetical protein
MDPNGEKLKLKVENQDLHLSGVPSVDSTLWKENSIDLINSVTLLLTTSTGQRAAEEGLLRAARYHLNQKKKDPEFLLGLMEAAGEIQNEELKKLQAQARTELIRKNVLPKITEQAWENFERNQTAKAAGSREIKKGNVTGAIENALNGKAYLAYGSSSQRQYSLSEVVQLQENRIVSSHSDRVYAFRADLAQTLALLAEGKGNHRLIEICPDSEILIVGIGKKIQVFFLENGQALSQEHLETATWFQGLSKTEKENLRPYFPITQLNEGEVREKRKFFQNLLTSPNSSLQEILRLVGSPEDLGPLTEDLIISSVEFCAPEWNQENNGNIVIKPWKKHSLDEFWTLILQERLQSLGEEVPPSTARRYITEIVLPYLQSEGTREKRNRAQSLWFEMVQEDLQKIESTALDVLQRGIKDQKLVLEEPLEVAFPGIEKEDLGIVLRFFRDLCQILEEFDVHQPFEVVYVERKPLPRPRLPTASPIEPVTQSDGTTLVQAPPSPASPDLRGSSPATYPSPGTEPRAPRPPRTQIGTPEVLAKSPNTQPRRAETTRIYKVRGGQAQWRKRIGENFNWGCCFTPMDGERFLHAAHILPYAQEGFEEFQYDIGNGLLIWGALHDPFDLGFFTIRPDLTVNVSTRIPRGYDALLNILGPLDGKPLRILPVHHRLNPDCLDFHNTFIFDQFPINGET